MLPGFTLKAKRIMARKNTKTKPAARKSVETLTHDDAKRKNIPTAEFQSVMAKEHESPIRVANVRPYSRLQTSVVEGVY
jgi:adenine-specific DNA-methyltransferase